MATFQEYVDVIASADAVTGALSGLGNVRITVFDVVAGANATIYSDQGVTPKSNPFTTTVGGKIDFFAADGRTYRIDIHDLNGSPRISDQSRYWIPGVLDNAVTTAKIVDGNVTTPKILDGNVTTTKILDANVTTAKILDNNVTPAKIPDGTLTSDEFVDATVNAPLGLSKTGIVRRGKSIIPTAGTRASTSYGALTNGPDQVSGIVLPTDGLIWVLFQARWSNTAAQEARAAIFLGANQLTGIRGDGVKDTPAAGIGNNSLATVALVTAQGLGLVGHASATGAEVTTGEIAGIGPGSAIGGSITYEYAGSGALTSIWNVGAVGGAIPIFAAAGTYTVSVQFKSASSGVQTTTVSDRKLWVWTQGF